MELKPLMTQLYQSKGESHSMDITTHEGDLSSIDLAVDFDIHGIVGIRLVNPTARDTARITKLLAPFQTRLHREPDITIRFEDDLSPPSLNYLGLDSAAFTEDDFYLLDRNSGKVVAQIPYDEVGQPYEIKCQSNADKIPQLFELIRLAFLRKNYISLHGAAFLYNGKGILVAGWSKGGKTETLVSFANHGAFYVADEWVLLSGDGQRMLGLPIPVTLWDWQLEQVSPEIIPGMSFDRKVLFKSIYFLDAVYDKLGRGRLANFFPVKALGRLMPVVKMRLNIRESPHILFKDRYCVKGATVDKLFLVISHSEPDIKITPCDPDEFARRMENSNEYEEARLAQYYRTFKYAFPQRENKFLDSAPELRSDLLHKALVGKEIYKVFHPYPVSFDELFKHLQPFC